MIIIESNYDIELAKKCSKGDVLAQETLYKKYGSRMRYVCLRYARTTFEADDILHEAFIKIFANISNYQGKSTLESWIKKICINTSIDTFKKNTRLFTQPYLDSHDYADEANNDDQFEDMAETLSNQELLEIINQLPEGYRMVFNLYAMENYTHQQIAQTLGITEGTSKSQLFKARKLLKAWVTEYARKEDAKVIQIQFLPNSQGLLGLSPA